MVTPAPATTTNRKFNAAPSVAILDYGIGNLHSAAKGLAAAGVAARLTSDPSEAARADALVLPGVGHFGSCMRALRANDLAEVAVESIVAGKPFLAICVGMQMLYDSSQEAPGVDGLAALPGEVKRLPDGVKLPQMQWNELEVVKPSPMLKGLDGSWMYFVHSYAPDDAANQVAICCYPTPVTAAVVKDNLWATQFHPEKSGPAGQRLLQNFASFAASAAC